MDYFHLQRPILFVPGKLDIAALRFVYFDKVEKSEGGFLKVLPERIKPRQTSKKYFNRCRRYQSEEGEFKVLQSVRRKKTASR